MSALSEVYAIIEGLQKRNLPIPAELQKEASELEIALLNKELTVAVQQYVEPIVSQIKSKFVLICEHTPGSPLSISVSHESDIVGLLDDAVTIPNNDSVGVDVVAEPEPEPTDEGEGDESEHQISRSKSVGFTVRFADGHVVSNSDAKETLINTLRYMGFEKVSKFSARTFKGFSLVDKRQRTDKGKDGKDYKWQESVEDGWFIYINMGNDTKKIVLQSVANFLGQTITISDNTENGVVPSTPPLEKSKGRRQLYSFNGRTPLDKRNSVLAVVKQFVANRPNATYKEIHRSFPDALQGSYGVIETLEDIKKRRNEGQDVDIRYFLDPHDILTSADGVQFAVSNQWGNQFPKFQNHIRNFGWTLKEVD
jgi:hypothetical protein